MFAADEYVTFFENGVSNVDWLELHSSFLDGNNGADFAYFGIEAVHLLAEAGDELVSTTTSENDVRIHASKRADGSVAVMVLNLNTSGNRTVNVSINGSTLSEDGIMYQTDGDSPLWPTDVANLGNSFSTSIAARTLQLFIIPATPTLDGDFNDDGIVNAADYTVWRNNLGSTKLLPNDPSPGMVTQDDYETWKANFGETASSGSGASANAAVPEPATSLLLILAAAGWRSRRRRAAQTVSKLINA